MVIKLVISGIILFFFVSGARRGFIRQCLEIIGIAAAFVGAFYLAHHLAAFFEARFELSYRISVIVSAIALFVAILILFHLLGLLLQKMVKLTPLGSFDRFGGGLFGAFKGALMVSLILVVLLHLPFPERFHREVREDAFAAALYPVLPVFLDFVLSRVPGDLDFGTIVREGRDEAVERLKEKADEAGEAIRKKGGKN